MPPDGIDPDVARLLRTTIQSVSELEVLLYFREHPDQDCESAAVARALYLDALGTEGLLDGLHDRGFLARIALRPNRYRYSPRTEELRGTLDRLAAVYPTRRAAVINLIFSEPGERLRNFADAFRLRKDS